MSVGRDHEPRDYSGFPPDATPGFNEWLPAEVQGFDSEDAPQPFQLLSIVLKSSSRQAEVFIHDPIRALTGSSAGSRLWEDDGFVGDPPLSEPPARINSVVLRHERTLEHYVVRSMALLDDDGSVTLVTHKQEHP